MISHPADHPGPFAFVTDLDAPELERDDEHHLRRALRLRDGDALTIGDGRGRWRTARLGASLESTGPVEVVPALAPPLTVAFALVKGDRPELVVQKLTELGIDRIVPLRAARSVVRWDEAKEAKAIERLRAVARAAAVQSHRPHLPEVADITEPAALVRDHGPGLALAARDGVRLTADVVTLLVGPEGGWDEAERSLGAPLVGLGANVLRAETAAIAAGVLLLAHRASALPSPPAHPPDTQRLSGTRPSA